MTDPARAPDIDRLLELPFEVDPVLTLGPLRYGSRDPTMRFEGGVVWRATRTGDGPATLRVAPGPQGSWRVLAWGPGAGAAFEALPRLLGADDDPGQLVVEDPRLRSLVAASHGLRFGRSDAVMESLVPAIIGQKVTSREAHRTYRRLVARYGHGAPGPGGLTLSPEPAVIAAIPYYELHSLGLEQRRAVTLIRAASQASKLEGAVELPLAAALTRLRSVPGIGAWTAAETARSAFGDPDVLSLGDYHLPDMVAWALAGEPRADDARMLELLEPYRGQRGRLVRILELSGLSPPRYGPRMPIRSIEHL